MIKWCIITLPQIRAGKNVKLNVWKKKLPAIQSLTKQTAESRRFFLASTGDTWLRHLRLDWSPWQPSRCFAPKSCPRNHQPSLPSVPWKYQRKIWHLLKWVLCTQACVVSRKKEGKGERREREKERERGWVEKRRVKGRERGEVNGWGERKEGRKFIWCQLVLSTKVKKATMNHIVGGTSSDNACTMMCLYTESWHADMVSVIAKQR